MSTKMGYPIVSIVIVNYNGKEFLKQCLDSVFENLYHNFEIIVVDNCSRDGSVEMINKIFTDVIVVQSEKNFGPAHARNRGINIAKGKYLAFLDNDTRVHPNWLKEAIKIFESDSKIGACQCKLMLDDTDNILDCVGEYLGQNGFLVQVVAPGEEKDKGQYDNITEIFAAKSAGMIARRSVLDKIGGFDEDYFIYLEESDLCWRIWLQGYKVILIPSSIVYHKFGTSSIVVPERINYLVKFHGTKNYISTLLKNLEFKNLIKIFPIHLMLWFGIALIFLLKRQFKSSKWIIQGILWNLKNYKNIAKKRKIIQKMRVVKDEEISTKIIRKRGIIYFLEKLKTEKKIGYALGWNNKGE